MLRQLLPRLSPAAASAPSQLQRPGFIAGFRLYSIAAHAASTAKAQDIDPSKLSIAKTTAPKTLIPPDKLVFGRSFTGIPLPPPLFAIGASY
jgi:branched-chain amino acid aminotransferase